MNNSKKILCVLLCGFVMAGCAVNKNNENETEEVTEQVSETTEISETTAAETTIAETSETPVTTVTEEGDGKVVFTDKKEPEKAIVFKGEGRKFSVFKNGDKVAEVTADHEVEAEPEARYEDFNFDGNKDLFLYDPSSDFRHYGGECWLWDDKKKQYVKTDKLDWLFGYGIDTKFSGKKIQVTYTERYNYSSSFICKAEFKWVNDSIVPVSLEKSADGLDRTFLDTPEDISLFRNCILNEVYEFNKNNEPVLKSRTLTEKHTGCKNYGREKIEEETTENVDNLNYFRITADSVKYMKGDTVIQVIPLKNSADLISQYRMKKIRNTNLPQYINDLVFSMDYDYDGYTDLCITTGVNEYGFADKFIYYHYDPDTGKFSEWDELNNTFDGAWIFSEESHRFKYYEKYNDIKPKEEYSKLSCDKYTPSGSGQYRETDWYVWKDNRLEYENTDVSVDPVGSSGSEFSFNAPLDGIETSKKLAMPDVEYGDGADNISFFDTQGLPAAESPDSAEKRKNSSKYDNLVEDAISELTYIPSGYSHKISDGKLIVTSPLGKHEITDKTFYDTDIVVYADFNFDGYTDFYTCDLNYRNGYYYFWYTSGFFMRMDNLEFYREGDYYVNPFFLKPDYENKTLTAYFYDYPSFEKESVTLRWKKDDPQAAASYLVPVSAVFNQYSWVSGHRIVKKCYYNYDENYDLILTGTEETVYEEGIGGQIPLISRKNEFDKYGNEKHFRFTENELQIMKGSSIVQILSLSDIFGTVPVSTKESVIPGDYISGSNLEYAEWDINFDGTDDLCIHCLSKTPEGKNKNIYSYYLFDKSTGMYRKWDSLSEKGYLYLPDYHEKILYYSTRQLNDDDDIMIYNYHKWENEQDVIYKQEIINKKTGETEIQMK